MMLFNNNEIIILTHSENSWGKYDLVAKLDSSDEI